MCYASHKFMPQHHISNILAVAFTLRDLFLYSAPCAHSPLPITLLGLLPEHDLREQGVSIKYHRFKQKFKILLTTAK